MRLPRDISALKITHSQENGKVILPCLVHFVPFVLFVLFIPFIPLIPVIPLVPFIPFFPFIPFGPCVSLVFPFLFLLLPFLPIYFSSLLPTPLLSFLIFSTPSPTSFLPYFPHSLSLFLFSFFSLFFSLFPGVERPQGSC